MIHTQNMKNVRTTPKTYTYEKTTVLLNNSVYERLKEKGKFGETYSDIVQRLLDEVEAKGK